MIYDKWKLRLGHDIHAFMEQIRDDDVEYVLILCDKTYKEKADARKGGAGKETLIISPEVYKNTKQEKYVPVVMEEGDVLPRYLDGRYYANLATGDNSGYEELRQHIFGKPAAGSVK